ncbi:MAG: hypothetical protein NZ941_00980 [Candidatus Caldarchaeum sp.]|nr:hypothetical protein [Candidatus Caldarchaeum sp.]
MTELVEYLKKYPSLLELYVRAHDFLPALRGVRIIVEPFTSTRETVLAYACPRGERTWAVAFRDDPPDALTLLHELVHVAGGDELMAYNYAHFILHAIENNMPCFNVFDLLELKLDDINDVLKEFAIENVIEYFALVGVIPTAIAEVEFERGGFALKLKRGVSEAEVVQTFLAELATALSFEPLARRIFARLVERLRENRD